MCCIRSGWRRNANAPDWSALANLSDGCGRQGCGRSVFQKCSSVQKGLLLNLVLEDQSTTLEVMRGCDWDGAQLASSS